MNVIFTPTSWQQYTSLAGSDRKLVRRINDIIKDIDRNGPMKGTGKPEVLKYRRAFSRRINDEHRLIYTMDDHDNLIIFACMGHYED